MNLARIREIARLEWRFNVTRPLFVFLTLVITLFAWGMSSGDMRVTSGDVTTGGKKAFITSMFSVAQFVTIIDAILFTLFLAIVAGMPVLRDRELRMNELLRSTPLRPAEYVFGKYLGVIAVYATAILLQIGLSILFNHGFTGPEDAEFIGPLVLSNYFVPQLAFVLPMSCFFAAVSFAVGTLSKRPALVFLSPIVLLLALVLFVWEKESALIAPWLNTALLHIDPSGFRWLTEIWLRVDLGVDFYNHRPITFDALFITSRLAVVGVAFGLVALTAWRVGAAERTKKTIRFDGNLAAFKTPETESPVVAALRARRLPHMSVTAPSAWGSCFDVFRLEAGAMLKHPALWLFVPLFALQIVGNVASSHSFLEASTLVTGGIAAVFSLEEIARLVSLLVLFFMVESLHREQNERLSGIVYATPIGTGPLLVGKVLASSVVAIAIMVACVIGFVISMVVDPKVPVEVAPFFELWGVLLLPTFLLWSAFIAATFAITGSRLATYAIALGALAFSYYGQFFGGWMSWVYNWAFLGNPLSWSDFGALDLEGRALVMNRVLAVLVAAVFAVIAVKNFPRTEPDPTRRLQRFAPAALGKSALRMSWILAPALAFGLYLNYEVQHGHQGKAAEKAMKDYWRRNVQTWKDDITPDIVHVDVDITLFPDARELASRGTYRLKNAESCPMHQLAFTPDFGWRDLEWTVDGEKKEPTDLAGLKVFALAVPLAPGAEISVGWSYRAQVPHGISKNGGGAGEFVLPTSVVLTSFSTNLAPALGYLEDVGVDGDNKSDAREYPDDYYVGINRSGIGGGAPFTVKTVIRGPQDFRLNGTGALVSDVVDGDTRVATFETDVPVRIFNVVAGKGLVATKGEGTALWHLPEHDYNIGEMMEALDGSRKWYSEWFYEYPWQELKITEFAGHASYAQGFSTNITFSEAIGFTLESSEESNIAFLVTAHECAHQWWGNLLTPCDGPGANILSEGLAHFSTALLTEQLKGDYQRMEFLKRIEQKYNDDRQADSERPLVKIDGSRPGDTTCTYDKPGFVFYMLQEVVGRDVLLSGLKSFIAKFRTSRDHAALEDLVEHLREIAPDKAAYDAFARQWFFEVVVPRFKVLEPTLSPPADGPWMAKGVLENRGTGRVMVEVAATRGKRFDDQGVALPDYKEARRKLEIGAGEKVAFEIPCDFEPEELVVDPDVRVLMLFRKEARAGL
jgi:ABC-2 type transport system permease protein